MSWSARQTSSQGSSWRASARHSSGPMPAGSPEVSAMRGSLGLELDVGFVPHAAQPQLGLLVRLAGPDGFHRLPALELVAVVVAAVPQDLHDVPAVLRVERHADLVVLQALEHRIELGHEVARSRPAQIAALGSRAGVL